MFGISEPSTVFHQQKTNKILCGSKFNAHLGGQVRHIRDDAMLPEHELRYTPEHELFFLFVWRSKITKRVWKLLRLFKPTNRESLTYFVSVRQFFILTRNIIIYIYVCIIVLIIFTRTYVYITFLEGSTKVNKERSPASHPPLFGNLLPGGSTRGSRLGRCTAFRTTSHWSDTGHPDPRDSGVSQNFSRVVVELEYFWNFHPEAWGKMIQFDERAYFSNGLGWFNHQQAIFWGSNNANALWFSKNSPVIVPCLA